MENVDLTTVPLPELYEIQTVVAGALARNKAAAGEVATELSRRFGAGAKLALEQAGKSHGTVTLPMQDGFALKTDTKQTVVWDSEALQAIARTLPWERVAALFSIKFSMSETIYKGIAAAAPELREQIDGARTTRIGEPVITLVKDA